jgi:NAD dependent epimerase/dehydratase
VNETDLARFYNGRRVLVTGGAGFIGSHLVEQLIALGSDVRVLARYNSAGSIGHLQELGDHADKLDIWLGDIADVDYVARCMEGIDTVFHLAALIGIPYSYVAPGHYVSTNVNGTVAVLEASRRWGTRRIVHTSTSETFGSAQYVPMDELHPLVAQSPYAATKVAADQLALSYFRSFATPVVVLRPFNTFGPRQSMRAIVPTVIQQLLARPDVHVGALTPIRDLNPVLNTVDAFLRAGATPDIEGELFVAGSGRGHSVAEVIETVGRLLGVVPQVVTSQERNRPAASEVDHLLCDYSKAQRVLGYQPRVSFEDGLLASIEYCRTHRASRLGYAV